MAKNISMVRICYLCGKLIDKENRDKDHVPPLQFFPSRIRKKYNLNKLKTLLTHKVCNQVYQPDEDYFFRTIGVVDDKNPILKEVWYDMAKSMKRQESQPLNLMILNQFTEAKSPSGIIIPNKISVGYSTERINRVIWKIIRGLYFIEFSKILPENSLHGIDYLQDPNLGLNLGTTEFIWNIVRNREEHGIYRRIFAYKYAVNPSEMVAAWGLLLWDRHIFIIIHDTSEINSIIMK